MTASRAQHVVSAAIVLAIAGAVTWVSFTQEPAAAFLFPQLISVFFIALALWNFTRAVLGMARVGEGVTWSAAMNFLPGLVVAIIFVFFAAKQFGFYVTSTVTFLVIYTLYDPAPLTSAASWGKRTITTALFMAVIYGLFTLLLKVQTPRGLLL